MSDEIEMIAVNILHHIDEMYPDMWKGVPKTARTSLRNTIINQVTMFSDAGQAKIDSLMLEYCPDEMSPERLEAWGKSQRSSDLNIPNDSQEGL